MQTGYLSRLLLLLMQAAAGYLQNRKLKRAVGSMYVQVAAHSLQHRCSITTQSRLLLQGCLLLPAQAGVGCMQTRRT